MEIPVTEIVIGGFISIAFLTVAALIVSNCKE